MPDSIGPGSDTSGKQRMVDAEEERSKKWEDAISEPVKEVVRKCLQVEPAERPDVDELIRMVEGVVAELPR